MAAVREKRQPGMLRAMARRRGGRRMRRRSQIRGRTSVDLKGKTQRTRRSRGRGWNLKRLKTERGGPNRSGGLRWFV